MLRIAILAALVVILQSGCDCELGLSNSSEQTTASNESSDTAKKIAAGTEGAKERKLSRLTEQYASITEVLELNEAETTAIESIHQQFEEVLQQWQQTDGKEMRDLQKQALQAARNRDKAALNRLNAAGAKEKVARFNAAEKAIQKDYFDSLIAAIPADKLDRWKAHRISVCLLNFLEPLEIDDKQKNAIREMAPSVIRSIGNESNWQGYGTSRLEKLFESRVLDAAQNDQFEDLKSKNRMRMLKWNNL
ncbi:MAG: hypothetical protein AAGA30_20165 [Planctomycetota bacterium]